MTIEDFLTKEEIKSLLSNAKIVSNNDNLKKDKKDMLNSKFDSVDNLNEGKNFNGLSKNLSQQQKQNINLLLDVQGEITVELGRTTIKVRDILSLGEGSIIELNKSANEAVDLIVNNQLFAKGEVVVIDENFGTRVTHILDLNQQFFFKKKSDY